jgi:hypothetical protein
MQKKKIAEKAIGNQRWKLRTPQWRENMIAGVKKRWERYRQMKNKNLTLRSFYLPAIQKFGIGFDKMFD